MESRADALQRLVAQLDDEPSLLTPDHLRRRLEALDLLDAHCGDDEPEAGEVQRRAKAIRASLEAVNHDLYAAIRGDIQRGNGRDTLRRWAEMEVLPGMGYDYLDDLVSGVFPFEEPDVEPASLQPEMVFYQPTPARHIFSLIDLTALTASDVLIDLGSGLGHVPLLVSFCTGARSVGIELEPKYVDCARKCAQRLNLKNATFFQQDARAADLSAGTVFYLHTPFTGSILRHVLDNLRREAAVRPIRICTYGPCTPVIAQESWLETTAAPQRDRLTVFSSRD